MADTTNIERLIEKWTPRIQAAFRQAIYDIADQAQIDLIATMLAKGDVDGALKAIGIDPAAYLPLDQSITAAFHDAGVATAAALPPAIDDTGHRLKIMFDARNVAAENWLSQHSSTKIAEIASDQRDAAKAFLQASLAKGENPKTAALDLVGRISSITKKREGGVLGLTSSQEAWARNYAEEVANGSASALDRKLRDKRFDSVVMRAIKTGKPIPADTQAAMVRAYRNKALKLRGDTIGRTEAMASLHVAQKQSVLQAIGKGQFTADQVRKVWRSAGDDRVRETHQALNGESVGLDELFVSPSGATLDHPGDPGAPASEVINCRCTLQYRIDFLKNVR